VVGALVSFSIDWSITMIMKWMLIALLTATYSMADMLPYQERQILESVAAQVGLSQDGTELLLVIRKIENGGPGREMGVMTPRAQRYKGNSERSLRLQAQWAAGTIKRHYRGDVLSFAKRYCPPRWAWWNSTAQQYLRELQNTDADTINPRLPDSVMRRQ
jgi:hypothetical protein